MSAPPFKHNILTAALNPIIHKDPEAPPNGINFLCSPSDLAAARAIVERAIQDAAPDGVKIDAQTAFMDVVACHVNSRRLKLLQWLMADRADFAHDFVLINRTINRKTGKLMLPDSERLLFQE